MVTFTVLLNCLVQVTLFCLCACWQHAIFCVRECAQARHLSVFLCVFSILVPRSHMTPPLLLLRAVSQHTLVQRVVYRDFPLLRVPLSLSRALSLSVTFILFLHASNENLRFVTITDELTDVISTTVNNTDVKARDVYLCNRPCCSVHRSLLVLPRIFLCVWHSL